MERPLIPSNSERPSVAIVGGGISGLSCLWHLKKEWGDKVAFHLFESSDRVGGWVETIYKENFLFELGPRSLRCIASSEADKLFHELDLKAELIVADSPASARFLFIEGKLQKIPSSLFSFVTHPLTRKAFAYSLKEGFVQKGDEEDESVTAFFSRRFSPKIIQSFIDPLVSGIFAGNPDQLSMQACFPHLWRDEKEHGSLVLAQVKRYLKKQPVTKIVSLKSGLGSLTNAFYKKLKSHIFLNKEVIRLRKERGRFEITFASGRVQYFDQVIAAIPALKLANLMPQTKLAELLSKSVAASVVVVNLGYKTKVLNYSGFGYLVPSAEKQDILGVVFDSISFPSQNLDPNQTRLSVMMGGAHRPDLLALQDEELANIAVKRIFEHLNISVKPHSCLVTKNFNSIPQYQVGHGKWLSGLDMALKQYPGLFLIGNSYKGISLNDCISSSKLELKTRPSVI